MFCACQDQKSEQKHTTKSFDEFHNHSPLLHVAMLEVLSVTFICLQDKQVYIQMCKITIFQVLVLHNYLKYAQLQAFRMLVIVIF